MRDHRDPPHPADLRAIRCRNERHRGLHPLLFLRVLRPVARSDRGEAAYFQIYLWKLAVEKAGDFAVDKVRDALRSGIEYDAPGGKVKVDPKTQHTYKRFRMGRIREDRQFDIIYEAPEWTAPEPYPQVAFPGWNCDWTQAGITKGPAVSIGQR